MTDSMDPDLRDLLAGWVGQELPPERCDALIARLKSDPGIRQRFAAEVGTLAQLRVVQSGEPRWLRLADELGWSGLEPADRAAADRVPDLFAALANEPAHAAPRKRTWRWITGGFLAAGVAVGVGGWWGFVRTVEPDGPRPVAEVPGPGLATLVYAKDVEWETAGQPPKVGSVLPATRLRVRSGTVTLSLFGGTTLTATGPADLELKTADRAFCHAGRVRARVPTGAAGFTVLVPGAAVVDQGTEFGVSVDPDGRSHLAVFAGAVDVLLMPDGGPVQSSRGVTVGQSVSIDPATLIVRPEPVEPDRFPAAPVVPPPALGLAPDYPDLIRAAKPWGYWRFESAENGVFPNDVPARPGLRATGPVVAAGAKGKRAVAFPVGGADQYLFTDADWIPPQKPGFAIELWAMPDALTPQTLAALVAQPEIPEEMHHALIEINGRRPVWSHPPGMLRFMFRSPPQPNGGLELFSDRVAIPHRWHHVVAQRDGDALEFYLDGQKCGAIPAGPGVPEPPACRLLLGRLKRKPSTDPMQVRGFVGLMDEVAVYDRPLTTDEIRRHAAGGRE